MRSITKGIYLSADELEVEIEILESEALRMPPDSEQHRQLMQDISKLRVYADMKRWLTPGLKSVGPS
jgi:hypothetical protein